MSPLRCWPCLLLLSCGWRDNDPKKCDSIPDKGDDTAAPVDDTAETSEWPAAFDANFLWETLEFDEAVDLGFDPDCLPDQEQVAAGAVTLTEVADDAGLAGSLSGGNTHGVGIGFFDVDGDGWADIFVANGIGNSGSPAYDSSLWHNNRDGTFSDVSASSGIQDILTGFDTYSVAAADYDADGDLDVYITAHPQDFLLQNNGSGVFTDVTEATGAGGPDSVPATNGSSKIAAWGDFDRDGLLDVAVASSQFTNQPENGYLLRNMGDGTFSDATTSTGFQVSPEGNPCAVLWTDYDNDGHQDLWVWNDRGDRTTNRTLMRNEGGAFTDVTTEVNATNSMGNPMGIDGADIDRNGWLDYYIGNIGPSALLLGMGAGTFADGAAAAGARGEYGWGLGFEDLNLDSWWDLFLAQEDNRDYLTFTHLGEIPARFEEQGWGHPAVPDGPSHNVAVAFADYDHDGDVDLVTAGTGGTRLNLYRNDTDRGTNHYLHVRVPVTPGTGEFGGVTGRVVVKTGGEVQFRDLQAGSSRASMNEMTVRFGLGQHTGADWVAVLWPDGRTSAVYNAEGNQVLEMP